MSTRQITPSQLSLFSISPVIGAWWAELRLNQGNYTNCIKWRTACQSSDGQLYPGHGLMFAAVEHSGRSVHAPEEIDRIEQLVDALLGSPYAIASGIANKVAETEQTNRLCRISSHSQGGGVH